MCVFYAESTSRVLRLICQLYKALLTENHFLLRIISFIFWELRQRVLLLENSSSFPGLLFMLWKAQTPDCFRISYLFQKLSIFPAIGQVYFCTSSHSGVFRWLCKPLCFDCGEIQRRNLDNKKCFCTNFNLIESSTWNSRFTHVVLVVEHSYDIAYSCIQSVELQLSSESQAGKHRSPCSHI